MKHIYYFFGVRDSYFTKLSYLFQKKQLFKHYYGMAYAKTKALKDPIYSHITYVSDILQQSGQVDHVFLREIEEKYQVNLAIMIHADRHLLRYPKEKRLFIAQELLRVFIHDMLHFNIHVVLAAGVADFISFFAVHFCEYHGIQFLYPLYAGYAGRAYLSDNVDALPLQFKACFEEIMADLPANQAALANTRQLLADYIAKREKPSYLVNPSMNYKIFRWKDVQVFFSYLRSYLYDRKGMHYETFPFMILFQRLLRIIRNARYRRLIREKGISLSTLAEMKYVIYPLHFEPEAATLVQGRWFNDQRKVIELISKNLPADTILVVKEHKPSIGRRPLAFYQDIIRHHNVYLIDDRMNTYQFIEQSCGVMVISSTMGMEALLLKKPVLAFGMRYYNLSNNVYKVNNYHTIKETIDQMLKHEFDETNQLALFHALLSTVKEMGSLIDDSEEDLGKFADEVASVLT